MKIVSIVRVAAVCAIASSWQMVLAQNVGNFYTGAVKVQVVKTYTGETLPKTGKVVIQDFTLDPAAVALDESAAGRMHTRIFLRRDPDDASMPMALAQQVQASFSKALMNDLKKSNIEALKAADAKDGPEAAVLVVSGEVTGIDEGNKVKRVMIGLGRGGSEVTTHVVVASVVNGRRTVVLELNLKSGSGKKLGALESVGGGSLALNVAEGDVSDRKSSVQADAQRMAKGVAKQIQEFMVAQHWVPAATAAVETAAVSGSGPGA